MSTLPNEVVDAILEHVDAVEQTMVDILPVGAWEARDAARSALEAAILAYAEEARREGLRRGAELAELDRRIIDRAKHLLPSPSPAEEARREAVREAAAEVVAWIPKLLAPGGLNPPGYCPPLERLRAALASPSPVEGERGVVSAAEAVVIADRESLGRRTVTLDLALGALALALLRRPPSPSPVEGDGARGLCPKCKRKECRYPFHGYCIKYGYGSAPSEPESGGTTPVPGPKGGPRGTFPGDLDRMPSGHTRHCEARMEWGDGECECGVLTTPTTPESDRE